MSQSYAPKIAIVAGEPSGDNLAAGLIQQLLKIHPNAHFFGIGGPKMRALGCDIWFDMTSIELIGLDGLFAKITSILRIRNKLLDRLLQDPPDIFIGIDVPDFNLPLERKIKRNGIPTIHYVSPTVWAWRGYRIHKIRRSVSHMLVLFPFEEKYYNKKNIPVTFVGHPAADEISKLDKLSAAQSLGIKVSKDKTIIALLPGSRGSEIKRLAKIFINVVEEITNRKSPQVQFLLPFANDKVRRIFEQQVGTIDHLPITTYDGMSQQVMVASDLVVLASGTATLEAALLGRPYVMVYRLSTVMYYVFKLLRHVRHYSMPNHLIKGEKVPELVQGDANAENIVHHICDYLDNPSKMKRVEKQFAQLPQMLKRDANKLAVSVVLQYLKP